MDGSLFAPISMFKATAIMSTANMIMSRRPETSGVKYAPPAAPAMPESANITAALR
jgi:hypothetical protein